MSDTTYVDAVVELEQVKREITALEVIKDKLQETVKTGRELGMITDEEIKVYGLTPSTKFGGYKDTVISLLKAKDLRDAIVTKETFDAKQVREWEETGVLSADELKEHKKPDSFTLSLPKTKGDK